MQNLCSLAYSFPEYLSPHYTTPTQLLIEPEISINDYTLPSSTQEIITLAHYAFQAGKIRTGAPPPHRPFVAKAVVQYANTKAKGQPIFPNEA
jgi:hypothetical protein